MSISGFSYVKNGFEYGYPFLEAIQSILPICDEVVVAVGESTDGTREAIAQLETSKIKIIDTIWDMKLLEGGKVFAQQANIALDNTSGDWAFHIQADEVIHENDLSKITDAITRYDTDSSVEGFILPFLHFWGGYDYIRTSRRVHKYEVRIVRNNKAIRSYGDSQGFRKYSSNETYEAGEKGEKLKVKKINAPVYHYSGVRPTKVQKNKMLAFDLLHNADRTEENYKDFDFQLVDRAEKFKGSHPKIMEQKVAAQDWEFHYDAKKAQWKTKDKIMQPIEDLLGFKFGEFKNYKLI